MEEIYVRGAGGSDEGVMRSLHGTILPTLVRLRNPVLMYVFSFKNYLEHVPPNESQKQETA